MSPITAELKCLYRWGKDSIESEAVTEVASHEDGGGRMLILTLKMPF